MAGHLLGLWYDPFEHVFDYWGDARETADQPGRYDTGDLQGPQDVVEYWAAKWVACLARKDPDASRRGPWRHPTTRSERAASSRRLFGMVAFRDSGRNARRRWSPLREWERPACQLNVKSPISGASNRLTDPMRA